MSHGGKRDGAGRKSGSITKRSRDVAEKAAKEGLTPLEFMLNVLRDESMAFDSRCWAAEKAAPYIHAKLANVEHTGEDGGPLQIIIRRHADN